MFGTALTLVDLLPWSIVVGHFSQATLRRALLSRNRGHRMATHGERQQRGHERDAGHVISFDSDYIE
jgi:hypothetical protein